MHRRSSTIVIVEDDASLLGALVFALETDGFVVRAFAGPGALLAQPPHADCLVVDLRMPGMDGLTLVSRLREQGLGAPAILITTNPDERTRKIARAAGVRIVEKPLITGELLGEIDNLIALANH